MALLVSACGFTEPRKFIAINEFSDTEGSFLISSLIGQRLRLQSSGILLICCHQSIKYYETCGKKLGYNLGMKKSFVAIEPLRDVINMPLKSIDGDKLLQKLYDDVSDKVATFRSDGMKNISIIFDDFSFFTNLGCSETQLIRLSMRLNELARLHDEVSIILKIGVADLHQYLANNVQEQSDVSITVDRMKSGDFWDVDGKLIIKKFKCDNGIYVTESERTLLYHVGDHNFKLIAPGEFGLKF